MRRTIIAAVGSVLVAAFLCGNSDSSATGDKKHMDDVALMKGYPMIVVNSTFNGNSRTKADRLENIQNGRGISIVAGEMNKGFIMVSVRKTWEKKGSQFYRFSFSIIDDRFSQTVEYNGEPEKVIYADGNVLIRIIDGDLLLALNEKEGRIR